MNGHPVGWRKSAHGQNPAYRPAGTNPSGDESDLKPFVKARRGIVGANLNLPFTLFPQRPNLSP